ncbi:uncharacterized protein LOC142325540 isoform X2 [Lycorma delicatula]|uniref:uncharacterized protein LOC142325540 isoform X2 n=1 Tax=Lycorma delicatula TaxID=130591 RepID=UPI003F519E87
MDTEMLFTQIAEICSLSVEDIKKLLSFGLFNFYATDRDIQNRLSKFLFNLIAITEDKNWTKHGYHYLRKKLWLPGFNDIIGVFLTWGGTPETLGVILPFKKSELSDKVIVSNINEFPNSYHVEVIMDFIINSTKHKHKNLIKLIIILVRCALDIKFLQHRSKIKTGIEHLLEVFDSKLLKNSILEICNELSFEKEHLPNAVNICTQVLPRTKRGNELALCISFNLLRLTSKLIKVQQNEDDDKKDETVSECDCKYGLEELLTLVRNCRNLWTMKLCFVYFIVLLMNDMVNRQGEEMREKVEIFNQLCIELYKVKQKQSQLNNLLNDDYICFTDLISKVISDWELIIRSNPIQLLKNVCG